MGASLHVRAKTRIWADAIMENARTAVGRLDGYRDGDRVMAEVRGAKSGPALATPGLGFVAAQSVSSARS